MRKTFEVEGDLDANARTLLALELGVIESENIRDNLSIITVFDVREGIEQVFEKFGLKVVGTFDRT